MSQFRNFIFTSMPCSTSCNIPSSENDNDNDGVTKVHGRNALTDFSVFTHNGVRLLNLKSNVKNKSSCEDGMIMALAFKIIRENLLVLNLLLSLSFFKLESVMPQPML